MSDIWNLESAIWNLRSGIGHLDLESEPMAESIPRYRLVIFDEVDEPPVVRDLFCRIADMHPTDVMQWVARAPVVWPWPMAENDVRKVLDGLYELGIAAEAWRVDQFPDLSPPRHVHDAACVSEGFRVKGLRGEPTHWVPWDKFDLVSAGRIEVNDEYREVQPPGLPEALASGVEVLLHRPKPSNRRARALRIPRDPVGELILVRRDPLLAFRVIESQMNYSYLGDRLRPSASENFPIFVADLCARADRAYVTPVTRAFLERRDPEEYLFPSSQALLEYSTHRLLWSWYRRDRDSSLRTEES